MATETTAIRTSHHDSLYFEDDGHGDFAELSNLLGDVFAPSDVASTDSLEGTISTGRSIGSFVSLPEFSYLPPAKAPDFKSPEPDATSYLTWEQETAAHYGEKLEPARVSPTPSISTCVLNSESLSQPSITEVESQALGRQGTRKRKSPGQNSVDAQNMSDAPSKQKIRRRERNREHAKRSRSKKKDLTKHLQESATILREENKKLKELVCRKLEKREEETNDIIKGRIVTPTDKFIAALKKPSNRVLSNSAVSYLRSLGKDCCQR